MAKFRSIVAFSALIIASSAFGQQAIYPAKGQSSSQQQKDKDQCYSWAKKQTGVDPAQVANQAAGQAPQAKHGQVAKGAAGGAIVGGVTGSPGTGAAVGAGVGAAGRHRAEKKAQKEQQAGQAEVQKQMDAFNKANAACLEGRGYTVQ